MSDTALKDGDYDLVEGAAWFTVKNIAIRIHTNDEGVIVDMYPVGEENFDSIASTYAFFTEADITD
jgi:hypothetical protein